MTNQDFDKSDRCLRFCMARWREMFGQTTPYSYQPRLHILPTLIDEYHAIAQRQISGQKMEKHLVLIRSELSLLFDKERHFITDRHCEFLLKEKILHQDGKDLVESIDLFKKSYSADFFRNAVIAKMNEVVNPNENRKLRKGEINHTLSTLASICLNEGIVNFQVDDSEAENLNTALDFIKCIEKSIKRSGSTFKCIVGIYCLQEEISHVRSAAHSVGALRTAFKVDGLSREPTLFISKKIKDIDASNALSKFKNEIQDAFNVTTLYTQRRPPEIAPNGWVIEKDKAHMINDRPFLSGTAPRKESIHRSHSANRILESKKPGVYALRSALELHGLALNSNDDRLRLVNLWSSLECLASIAEGKTTMERVQRLAINVITWRRIDKIFRWFCICLKKELDSSNCFPYPCSYVNKRNGVLEPHLLLMRLVSGKKDEIKREIFRPLASNELLLFRGFELYNLACNGKSVRKDLEQSRRRLEWHLWRIYRARNMIVHEGAEIKSVGLLADHLQQYVSYLISRLIDGMSFGKDWSPIDSWNYWRNLSDYVFFALNDDSKILRVGDFFPRAPTEGNSLIWT